MTHSLHNHTKGSDGRLDARAMVEKAIEGDLEFVGIADHYGTNRVNSIRDLKDYMSEIKGLKKDFEDKISIFAGVEVDGSQERTDFDSLDYNAMNRLDYVLFEYVQDELWKGMPVWEFINVRKRLRVPCGLAHNDLGRNFGEIRTDYLADVFVSNDIFIELNCGRRYSKMGKFYYELSEALVMQFAMKGVRFSIGCDGHRDDVGEVSKAMDFVRVNEMEKSLVTAKDFLGGP
jgi:DNA polymerase (family 10)